MRPRGRQVAERESASDGRGSSMTPDVKTMSSTMAELRVCQATTCTLRGSEGVLVAIEDLAPANLHVSRNTCLSRCGAGPNVRCTPAEVDSPVHVASGIHTVRDAARLVARLTGRALPEAHVRAVEIKRAAAMLPANRRMHLLERAARELGCAGAPPLGPPPRAEARPDDLCASVLALCAEAALASGYARAAQTRYERALARLAPACDQGAARPTVRRRHRLRVTATVGLADALRAAGSERAAAEAYARALEMAGAGAAQHGRVFRAAEVRRIEGALAQLQAPHGQLAHAAARRALASAAAPSAAELHLAARVDQLAARAGKPKPTTPATSGAATVAGEAECEAAGSAAAAEEPSGVADDAAASACSDLSGADRCRPRSSRGNGAAMATGVVAAAMAVALLLGIRSRGGGINAAATTLHFVMRRGMMSDHRHF